MTCCVGGMGLVMFSGVNTESDLLRDEHDFKVLVTFRVKKENNVNELWSKALKDECVYIGL